MSAPDLPISISVFPTAMPSSGEAVGRIVNTTWGKVVSRLSQRREGLKDGPCIAPATFEPHPDGVHVGRKKNGAMSRTMIMLDIEFCKKTGEIPPSPAVVADRIAGMGLAGAIYTSHSHTDELPRFRVALTLSEPIACHIPACEIMATDLGLSGAMDQGKTGPASVFYLPSCAPGTQDGHYFAAIDGMPVDADIITDTGIAILTARQVEHDRIAAVAQAAAAERRVAKIAAGFDPDDSLIEKIRMHLDGLETILLAHGYEKSGQKFKHPNSSSGAFGGSIKNLGGVDRFFSHNSSDPLHADNLPAWCGKVTALDSFDITAILDFAGDRDKALAGLAARYGLSKVRETKALATLIFRMIRQQASQPDIEAAAIAEGENLGLSRVDVFRVAQWISTQPTRGAA
jgi:hypothetical protein